VLVEQSDHGVNLILRHLVETQLIASEIPSHRILVVTLGLL